RGNRSDNGIPFSGGLPSPQRTISWHERQMAMPFSFHRDTWEMDAQLSRVGYDSMFIDPEDAFGFTESRTESESRRARASATRHFGESSWLAFGGELERLEVDDRSVFGANLEAAGQTTRSLFAQLAHDIGTVRVDLGVRHDDNDAFGSRTTPRLGFLMAVSADTRLRASWGQGFRAPSIGELFYPFSGNVELQPEESESVEVAIEHEAGKWQLGAAAFENRVRNLIDFDFVSFSNRNVGRARSRGVEAWSRYAGRLLTAVATATVLTAEDRATGEALLRRPEESASLIATVAPGPWVLNLSTIYVGERPDVDPSTFSRIDVGSHLRVDVAARFGKWARFEPYARIENLGDRRYEAVAGFPASGRRWVGGCSLNWTGRRGG
ncbi:MAG: TonB-dependent receptor, partial [Acidobacteriota bacterium]|nr:TonB-dependent receptor [Acidobacteriota bacterium]